MEVAVEVEVDLLHRPDLRLAAAGAAALDAEHRAHRRLAQAQHHLLADLAEPLRQRDAGRRLALAGLGRRDRGDDDELAVGLAGEAASIDSFTLPRYSPNSSSSSGWMPAAAAMSAMGRSCGFGCRRTHALVHLLF